MLHLNRALDLDGTNAEAQRLLKLAAHYALGAALGDEGRLKEAAAEFREALRLRPNYPEARKNLDLAESLLREKRQQ